MTIVYALSLPVIGLVGLLGTLALVLRGTQPSERAELVRAVADLFRRSRGPGA